MQKVLLFILTLPLFSLSARAEITSDEYFQKGGTNGVLLQDYLERIKRKDRTFCPGLETKSMGMCVRDFISKRKPQFVDDYFTPNSMITAGFLSDYDSKLIDYETSVLSIIEAQILLIESFSTQKMACFQIQKPATYFEKVVKAAVVDETYDSLGEAVKSLEESLTANLPVLQRLQKRVPASNAKPTTVDNANALKAATAERLVKRITAGVKKPYVTSQLSLNGHDIKEAHAEESKVYCKSNAAYLKCFDVEAKSCVSKVKDYFEGCTDKRPIASVAADKRLETFLLSPQSCAADKMNKWVLGEYKHVMKSKRGGSQACTSLKKSLDAKRK